MANQEWWVQDVDRVDGPFTPQDLRQLAATAKLQATTLVSQDKIKWIAASRLKSLFPSDNVRVEPAQEETSPSTSLPPILSPPPHDSAEFPWPIVRTRRYWHGSQDVVMITPKGIHLTRRRKPLTEECVDPLKSSSQMASWTHISADSIQSVRVRRYGYFSKDYWWNRFTVQTLNGARHSFAICDRELPNVKVALWKIAGGKYDERPSRRPAASELAVGFFGVAAAVLIAYSLLMNSTTAVSTAVIIAVSVFIGFFISTSIGLGMLYEKGRSEFQPNGVPRRKRWRKRSSRKAPFRSPLLGWTLKTIGLLYILVLASDTELASRLGLDALELRSIEFYMWIFYLPGIGLMVLGYRLCLRTFDARQHPDPRAPILYLRAFDDDDKRTFQPTGLLAQLHGLFRFAEINLKSVVFVAHPTKLVKLFLNSECYTSEELLARAFQNCGPLIAIGRPGEFLATSGADRMYVANEDWQNTVLEYLRKSQAVILQPANTQGVRWEIERVFSIVPKNKILLSMLNFKDRPNDYEDFRSRMKQEFQLSLPVSLPFENNPACLYFEPDSTVRVQPLCYRSPLLWTFVGNAIDVRKTFSPFIRGLHGEKREAPHQPRRSIFQEAISIPLALGSVFAFYFLIAFARQATSYQASVTTDIVKDQVLDFVPMLTANPVDSTYQGKSFPYTFRLSSDWSPAKVAATDPNIEFDFDYRNGLGKLQVIVLKDVRLGDLYSETFPHELRKTVESLVHQTIPDASVELINSEWTSINSRQFRRVTIKQKYSSLISESRDSLYCSGPSGSLVIQLFLPDNEHYSELKEKVLASFETPESDIDLLIADANAAKLVKSCGKQTKYSVTLSSAWREMDLAAALATIGDTGERLLEMGGGAVDASFKLGDQPGFATLEASSIEGDFDLQEIGRPDGEEFLKERQVALETALVGFKVQTELVDFKKSSVGGKEWVEMHCRQLATKDSFSRQTWLIIRLTPHRGQIISLNAEIANDHPEVRRLVTEALDSVKFAE